MKKTAVTSRYCTTDCRTRMDDPTAAVDLAMVGLVVNLPRLLRSWEPISHAA
jgi:hypothetical protein